jgi:hypothetical protein
MLSIEEFGRGKCSSCNETCDFEQLIKRDGARTIFFGSCVSCRYKNNMLENKVCKCCKQIKPKTEFYKFSKYFLPNCKQCHKDNYRKAHPKGQRKPYTPKRNAVLNKSMFKTEFKNQQEYRLQYSRIKNQMKRFENQSRKTIDSRIIIISSFAAKRDYSTDIFKYI